MVVVANRFIFSSFQSIRPESVFNCFSSPAECDGPCSMVCRLKLRKGARSHRDCKGDLQPSIFVESGLQRMSRSRFKMRGLQVVICRVSSSQAPTPRSNRLAHHNCQIGMGLGALGWAASQHMERPFFHIRAIAGFHETPFRHLG